MKGNFISKEENAERTKLYNLGYTDRQIGKERNISEYAIYGWRHARGLKANGGSGLGGRRCNTKYWKGVQVNG